MDAVCCDSSSRNFHHIIGKSESNLTDDENYCEFDDSNTESLSESAHCLNLSNKNNPQINLIVSIDGTVKRVQISKTPNQSSENQLLDYVNAEQKQTPFFSTPDLKNLEEIKIINPKAVKKAFSTIISDIARTTKNYTSLQEKFYSDLNFSISKYELNSASVFESGNLEDEKTNNVSPEQDLTIWEFSLPSSDEESDFIWGLITPENTDVQNQNNKILLKGRLFHDKPDEDDNQIFICSIIDSFECSTGDELMTMFYALAKIDDEKAVEHTLINFHQENFTLSKMIGEQTIWSGSLFNVKNLLVGTDIRHFGIVVQNSDHITCFILHSSFDSLKILCTITMAISKLIKSDMITGFRHSYFYPILYIGTICGCAGPNLSEALTRTQDSKDDHNSVLSIDDKQVLLYGKNYQVELKILQHLIFYCGIISERNTFIVGENTCEGSQFHNFHIFQSKNLDALVVVSAIHRKLLF